MKVYKIGCRTLRVPVELAPGQKIPLGTAAKRKKVKILSVKGNAVLLDGGLHASFNDGTLTVSGGVKLTLIVFTVQIGIMQLLCVKKMVQLGTKRACLV